ncbi:MAG: PA14 domain-containing protein [Candidatus Saccharibacteria bacterium]|nr:PA14 domain-containing protein [Candidatus Saccharibacteria bacterium]
MKKKKRGIGIGLGVVIFGVAMTFMVISTMGMTQTIGELRTEIAKSEADVVLAEANVVNNTRLTIPVTYRKQNADECINMYNINRRAELKSRQFEWSKCDYYLDDEIEPGIVGNRLDENEMVPIAVGGKKMENQGVKGEEFSRWFKGESEAKILELIYDKEAGSFKYENEKFYLTAKEELFTVSMEIPVWTVADGKEEFRIVADDDTWVFVGDKLVVDMGGIHNATSGEFRIDKNGRVTVRVGGNEYEESGVSVEGKAVIRIFHANRDSQSSVFKVYFDHMILNLGNTVLAQEGDNGSEGQIAFEPVDSQYIAPLGENLKVSPNKTRSIATMIIVQGIGILVSAMLILMATSWVSRYLRRDHIRGE